MNLESQMNSMSQDEISLLDILRFLKSAYKTILIFGVLGVVIATAYLAITPKQYEASVQIAMAQTSSANNNISPLGINIEEPALLIARLSSPTSYTPKAIAACGLQDQINAALALSKAIKVTIPKGVANLVDLKTFGESPQVAQDCAQGVFDLIKTTQAQIMAPYIEEAKVKLADDQERLQKAKEVVARSDKSGAAIGASYLSTRDEIRYLLDEITALKNIVTSNQNRATRMVAPIFASDAPIAPKKRMVLAAGVLGGLFLGVLIALARQIVLKLKSAAGGVLWSWGTLKQALGK